MINSKLLLTTATSLCLAIGSAQAGITLPTAHHAGAVAQVQCTVMDGDGIRWRGWDWARASSPEQSLRTKLIVHIPATSTTRVPTMARTTIPRTTAGTRAKYALKTFTHSIGAPVTS